MIKEKPLPLEETDPELAKFFEDVANGREPYRVKEFCIEKDDVYFEFAPIRAEKKTGRNEPCPCGSGKKFKKCCLNKG